MARQPADKTTTCIALVALALTIAVTVVGVTMAFADASNNISNNVEHIHRLANEHDETAAIVRRIELNQHVMMSRLDVDPVRPLRNEHPGATGE